MSNPLELPFGAPPRKAQDPSQSPRSEPETITNLRSTILASSSRLGGGNHQEKQVNPTAKHNNQVPLDAITQSNALGCSPISPNDESIKQEWLERSSSALRDEKYVKVPREGAQGWPFHLNRHPKSS